MTIDEGARGFIAELGKLTSKLVNGPSGARDAVAAVEREQERHDREVARVKKEIEDGGRPRSRRFRL